MDPQNRKERGTDPGTDGPKEGRGKGSNKGVETRFRPGQSGNPGGRPKGLAARVRTATSEGADIVEFMVGVLRNGKASNKDRIEAAKWLADRGFGRAVETTVTVQGSGETSGALADLADAQLEHLARTLKPADLATPLATVLPFSPSKPPDSQGK